MKRKNIKRLALAMCALAIIAADGSAAEPQKRAIRLVRTADLAEIPIGLSQTTLMVDDMKTSELTNPEGLFDPARGPAVFKQNYRTDLAGLYQFMRDYDLPPAVRHGAVLIDFGKQADGVIVLEIEGPAKAMVEVHSGSFLIGDDIPLAKKETISLQEGRFRWESAKAEKVRYAWVVFRNPPQPVNIHSIAFKEVK